MTRARNYSLTGPSTREAFEAGLVAAAWYKTPIDRKTIKALMQRKDSPAVRDTVILFSVMFICVVAGIQLWPSWWSLPFWIVYGVLYGSAMDSRWHECGHGTAFKSPRLNNLVYQIASFMMVRNPVTWRWSHARHHTDTLIVGRDPEIVVMRPPSPSIFAAYRELWPIVRAQLSNPETFLERKLPESAQAYLLEPQPTS